MENRSKWRHLAAAVAVAAWNQGLWATDITIPNGDFSQPDASTMPFFSYPFTSQLPPIPNWQGTEMSAGVFYNSPFSPFYITNLNSDQAGFLYAVPTVEMHQELASAAATSFQVGQSYHLQFGVSASDATVPFVGAVPLGAPVEFQLYYLDASNNKVTVGSQTLTNTGAAIVNQSLLDMFQLNVPLVRTTDPWAGKPIGIQVVVPENSPAGGGIWNIGNLGLTTNSTPDLSATAGALSVGPVTGSGTTTVSGAGTILSTPAIQTTGNVSITSGGTVALDSQGGTKMASVINSLTIDSGTLDVKTSAVILPNIAVPDAAALVAAGAITSSSTTIDGDADAAKLLVLSGSSYIAIHGNTTLDDQTVTPGQTIVTFALYGDTTLKGSVTLDDYLAMDRSYAEGVANGGWASGDFNGDGVVNAADYALMDCGYADQGGVDAAGLIALHAREFGLAYTIPAGIGAIPEPASLALLGCGLLALACRGQGTIRRIAR